MRRSKGKQRLSATAHEVEVHASDFRRSETLPLVELIGFDEKDGGERGLWLSQGRRRGRADGPDGCMPISIALGCTLYPSFMFLIPKSI